MRRSGRFAGLIEIFEINEKLEAARREAAFEDLTREQKEILQKMKGCKARDLGDWRETGDDQFELCLVSGF
ncbi:hypothetical protein L596_028108 [Steinernema carpocapsae]|uniref:Uncharacterized protein n=1 Tax=Steinernema carpocapsae TaxID=34508 RepID=A0A4U5LXI8_STECR|nr:hypothetical protein L596_028108 [Steinernema carpocapsae]